MKLTILCLTLLAALWTPFAAYQGWTHGPGLISYHPVRLVVRDDVRWFECYPQPIYGLGGGSPFIKWAPGSSSGIIRVSAPYGLNGPITTTCIGSESTAYVATWLSIR